MADAVDSGLSQPEIDEFEIMRRRIQDQGQRRRELAQRTSRRQFARLGTLPSGAAIKAESQAQQVAEQQTGREIQDVNIAQQRQLAERTEAQAGRAVQRLGITTAAETTRRGQDVQRELGLAGITSQELVAQRGVTSQELIAERGVAAQRELGLKKISSSELIAQRAEAGAIQRAQISEAAAASRLDRQITSAEGLAESQRTLDLELSQLREAGASERQLADHTQQVKLQDLQNINNLEVLRETNTFRAIESVLDREAATNLQNASLEVQKGMAEAQLAFDNSSLAATIDQFNRTFEFQQLSETNKQVMLQAQQEMAAEELALKTTLTNHTMTQANSELAVNKMITAVNMIGPLKENGFSNADIASTLEGLGLGVDGEGLLKYLSTIDKNIAAARSISSATQTDAFARLPGLGDIGRDINFGPSPDSGGFGGDSAGSSFGGPAAIGVGEGFSFGAGAGQGPFGV